MKGLQTKGAFTVLEVMLAITLFAFVVVGAVTAMNKSIEAAADLRREREIRRHLQSYLAETRQKVLEPGRVVLEPNVHGIVYEQEVDQVNMKNEKGAEFFLYKLTIRARWKKGELEEKREAELLIYQP